MYINCDGCGPMAFQSFKMVSHFAMDRYGKLILDRKQDATPENLTVNYNQYYHIPNTINQVLIHCM